MSNRRYENHSCDKTLAVSHTRTHIEQGLALLGFEKRSPETAAMLLIVQITTSSPNNAKTYIPCWRSSRHSLGRYNFAVPFPIFSLSRCPIFCLSFVIK